MAAEPVFLEEAIEEVVAAVSHYQLVASPGTARRLFLEANAAMQRVLDAPTRWPVEASGYRRWRLDTFPYSWRYEVKDVDAVLFIAFVHARRRPGYFSPRVR